MLCRYAIPLDVAMVIPRIGSAQVSLFFGFRNTANRSPRSKYSVTKQLNKSKVSHQV